jgi:hypothetical protein
MDVGKAYARVQAAVAQWQAVQAAVAQRQQTRAEAAKDLFSAMRSEDLGQLTLRRVAG